MLEDAQKADKGDLKSIMGIKDTNQKIKKIEMTSGPLWKNIFLFSVPLMFAQLLEVMFNLSDVAVVGRFADYKALGSVGSTTILVTLFTGLLIGMGSGVNVQTAISLGAGNQKKVEHTVHTSLLICTVAGLIVGAVCFLFADGMLSRMNTKPELIDQAVLYLKIYALGLPALAVYNFGNGVLSAGGDTKRPLYCLTFSGILNVILNLIFVIGCHLDVAGVALASVTSQYVSAILVVGMLIRSKASFAFHPNEVRKEFNADKLRRVLQLGVPAAFQNTIFSVANLFVQASVNSFDHVMVEGNSAAANADPLVYDMMAAFYTAGTSFIAQNRGAGKRDRMMKSYVFSIIYSFTLALALGVGLYVMRYAFLGLFTSDREVMEAGIHRLSVMALSYAVSAFMDATIAASRGLGKTVVPTVVVILGSCVFRLVWIYTVFASIHTIRSLYLLYPVSWSITAVAEITYFIWIFKRMRE